MPNRAPVTGTIRHTHKRFICLFPIWDRTGLWPVVSWLWWSWDRAPEIVGQRVLGLMVVLNKAKSTDELKP